jgi:hypothetical protein
MNPKFEYYFQADPVSSKPMYALYDVLDKHFMIQSSDYNVLYRLMYNMRSKTCLEIAKIPSDKPINNSNIEQWQISNLPQKWFGDLVGYERQWNPTEYHNTYAIQHPDMIIEPNSVIFDEFKKDLQKQIFFFYYCFEFIEKTPSELISGIVLKSIEQSNNYDNILDIMLDDVPIVTQQDRVDFYNFIRQVGLCYE